MQTKKTYIVISSAGPHRDLSRGSREQPFWDEHEAYIDRLVDDGFIVMGGPLVNEGGALLVVSANNEHEARDKVKDDPWYTHGILELASVKRWDIFIDKRC